jgi:hypothetical protein
MQLHKRKRQQSLVVFVEGSIEKTVSVRPYRSPLYRQLFSAVAPVLLLVAPSLCYLIWGETATIRITMTAVTSEQQVTILARANPSLPEHSPTRHLTATQTVSTNAVATGTFHQDATEARGTLIWFNQLSTAQTVPARTTIALTPHLQVVTDTTLMVPAAVLPALGEASGTAHIAQAGSLGNIEAGKVNEQCGCAGLSQLTVRNADAFSGGQDEINQTLLQQADVDRAVSGEQDRLQQQARASLQSQRTKSERLIGSTACGTQVETTPAVGSVTAQAHVSISTTCQANAYNSEDVQNRAISLFRNQTQPSPGYVLDQTSTVITQATETPDGITLQVVVKGHWNYPISEKQWDVLRSQLVGRTPAQAETFLETHLKAIKQVTINHLWFWLPDDPKRIVLERTDA